MKDVYKYKDESSPVSFKDADSKKGIVTGYFSNFNTVDSDGDIIRPGAYTKTIKENGPHSSKPRIKHLLNHNSNEPLGNLLDLKEDSVGLYYESQVGTHNLGVDFIKMVESGLITEHSIGFRVIKRNQIGDGKYTEGKAEWEIVEIKLWEGSSLTAWGANQYTPITGMKSEDKVVAAEKASKRIDLLTKSLRNGTFTDETFELLEIELKQLQQLFIDLTKSTKAADEALEPEKKGDESLAILAELRAFSNNLKTAKNGSERSNHGGA